MNGIRTLISAACLCLICSTAWATSVTLTPDPADALNSLDHYKYYVWGIDWNPAGEVVTAATLRISQLYDYTQEIDRLYMHLLAEAPLGTKELNDPESAGMHDYFQDNYASDAHEYLTVYFDPIGGSEGAADFEYDFDADDLVALNSFLAGDNNFGIGLDPDCHYYNDGVSLEITAGFGDDPVPEPLTVIAVFAGLAGLGRYVRRRTAV